MNMEDFFSSVKLEPKPSNLSHLQTVFPNFPVDYLQGWVERLGDTPQALELMIDGILNDLDLLENGQSVTTKEELSKQKAKMKKNQIRENSRPRM